MGVDTTPEDIIAEWGGHAPEVQAKRDKARAAIERLRNGHKEEPKAEMQEYEPRS
jgi:hypothetical protein